MSGRLLRFAAYFLLLPLTHSASAEETFQGKPIMRGQWNGYNVEYVQNEILIALAPSYTETDLLEQIGRPDVSVARTADRFGFLTLETSTDEGFFELMDEISRLESTRFAEPNIIHRLDLTPNDPSYSAQWHYHNTGQTPPGGTPDADIDAPESWDFTTGVSTIMIGVLDTGIPMEGGELSHPDLDDPTRFVIGPNLSAGGGDAVDGHGHGTHVAGTIGAESHNGIGVAGVTWNCRIMAIKVFSDAGVGSSSLFRDGVIHAVDSGCQIVNYSGGGGSPSSYSEHGVAYADSHGVIICAAAGNNWQGAVDYPAAYATQYDNVICVSATDHNDESSAYSSIGPEVTISAPGGHGSPYDDDDVLSTLPNYECTLTGELGLPLSYGPLAGTSMASPHAAGLAALILSVNPTLTPAMVRDIMCNTSDDLGPPGWDEQFGHGRISAYSALLQMGEVNIGHQPLLDTKNYTTDYLVDCTIFSIADLVTDSLLLYYRVDVNWVVYQLELDRDLSSAHGWIPHQSPGTYIDYYLFAKNIDGARDSTDIYTFKVIDYQLLLGTPSSSTFARSEDTAWYSITVSNDGTLADEYALTASGNAWNSTFWDEAGTQQITSSGNLSPDQSLDFQLRVVLPVTVNGDWDSVTVTATSAGDASQTASLTFVTTSTGAPLALPFLEEFISTEFDVATWVEVSGATVSEDGYGEPSAPYSLNLDGDPAGADTIVSQIILIVDEPAVNLVYYYQQTGGGESPDVGDDLFVEFLDDSQQWVLLKQQYGVDNDMASFEEASIALPPEANHDGFRVRFRNIASEGLRDDWFVDDISFEYSPQIEVGALGPLDVTLGPDQTAEVSLYVTNVGASNLHYDVEIIHDFSLAGLFTDLAGRGAVEPSSRRYTPDVLSIEIEKGDDDPRVGYDVAFDAGGPDDFGYFWIDSDESSGPLFNWVDISSTGTIVAGLSDDDYAGPFPIGFDFIFYGDTCVEFYVSSNGFIGFGPPDNYEALANKPIPTYDAPDNIVALLWDDLNHLDANNPGGEIRYQTAGDRLIVQYINMPEYLADVGDVFNGQILLNRDGTIKLQYLDLAPGFDKNSCTVGIERYDGFDGLEIVFNASYLHDSLCVVVSHSTVPWLSVSPDHGVVPVGGTDTLAATYNSTNLGADTYAAEIRINNNDPDGDPWMGPTTLTVEREFVAGDANGDQDVDIDDVVFLVAFVFSSGTAPDPFASGDVDCSGGIDIDDAVYLINFVFSGGPAPAEGC